MTPKILRRFACGLSALALIAACHSGNQGSTSSPSASVSSARVTPGTLHREGRWMVDGSNRIVLMHGVNAVWKLKPYFAPDTVDGFTVQDADWLAEHGFNSVRLGVLFSGVMPQRGVIEQGYLTGIDRVVQLLASRGIWVMLDFHQDLYSEKFNGEGFPEWSVYDDGLPHPYNFGFPGNYLTPETTHTFDNFWSNKNQLWDMYRDAWVAVAAKWKDQPFLMGYDLINEPWAGSETATCAQPVGCPVFDTLKLQAFQEHVLAGIRQVDKMNLVWMEPNILFDFGVKYHLATINALNDPQLGLSWHTYCLPAALLHSKGVNDVPGCTQLHQTVFGNAEEAISRIGSTTMMSEFGASDDLPDIQHVADIADQQLTSWQYWHYKGWHDPTSEDPTGAVQSLFRTDTDLGSVKLDKLKMLERAYPMATAGTPIALSFDVSTAKLKYTFTPKATANAPTELHMPRIHYPNGYKVAVTGGIVTSAPGARTLIVEGLPGANTVVVEASPK